MQASLQTLLNPLTHGLISLEINPPHGTDVATALAKLAPCLSEVDLFNVTDCALAKLRMSAIPFAAYIKRETNKEVLVNLACRDRNLLAMQSDLLAAWAFGVHSIVALTGDALSAGDFIEGKAVFEVNSVGLLRVIAALNGGKTSVQKELKGAPSFICGAVVNPNARNLEAELKRALRKKEAGAKYFLSQPVFDVELAANFLTEFNRIVDAPCLLGVAPLKNAKALEGIQKVPGIKVSQHFFDGITASKDPGEFSKQFCVDTYKRTHALCCGVHVVAGAYPSLALEVVAELAKTRTAFGVEAK